MAYFEHHFVLPTVANDGRDVQTVLFSQLETRVCDAFGGWTKVDSKGCWLDPESGRKHLEPGLRYSVAVDHNDPNAEEQLRGIIKWAKDAWGQECIYYEVQGVVEYVSLATAVRVSPVSKDALKAAFGIHDHPSAVRIDLPREYGITSLLVQDTPEGRFYLERTWNTPTVFPLGESPIILVELRELRNFQDAQLCGWIAKHCTKGLIIAGDQEMLEHDQNTEVCYIADVA